MFVLNDQGVEPEGRCRSEDRANVSRITTLINDPNRAHGIARNAFDQVLEVQVIQRRDLQRDSLMHSTRR